MLPTNLEGGGGHPNLATQTVYADIICEYLDSTLLVGVDNGDDAGSINWVYPVLAAVGTLVVIIVVVVVVLRKKKSTSEE